MHTSIICIQINSLFLFLRNSALWLFGEKIKTSFFQTFQQHFSTLPPLPHHTSTSLSPSFCHKKVHPSLSFLQQKHAQETKEFFFFFFFGRKSLFKSAKFFFPSQSLVPVFFFLQPYCPKADYFFFYSHSLEFL